MTPSEAFYVKEYHKHRYISQAEIEWEIKQLEEREREEKEEEENE